MTNNPVALPPDTDTVPAQESHRVLIGLSEFEPVYEQLQQDNVTTDPETARQIHQHAQDAISPLSRSFDTSILDYPDDEDVQDHIAESKSSAVLRQFLTDRVQGTYQLGLVPIDSLIAVQSSIGTDAYACQLPRARWPVACQ